MVVTFGIAWTGIDREPLIPDPNFPGGEGQLIFALGVLPVLLVGWLLTNRATANPYGWLWLLLALVVGAQQFVQVWASELLSGLEEAGNLILIESGSEPYFESRGGEFRVVQWLGLAGDYLWATGIVVLAFILLMFPDGRLPSVRWRWVARAMVGGLGILILAGWAVGGISGTVPVPHPKFLDGAFAAVVRVFFDGILVVAILLGLGAGALSVIIRFRRSRGIERQQIKWVALAGLLFVPTVFWDAPGIWDPIVETIVTASVPAAVALAVTRYRLYEIDRVLSRTVAYGLLIALLTGAYLLGIFLLQRLFPQQGELAVAATTLAVAAIFNPVRRQVVAAVDRRFNRARYDAEHIVNSFADRLRDQVDVDAVAADIGVVVGRALQPNRLALWIRP
jgi:hypothetical protein